MVLPAEMIEMIMQGVDVIDKRTIRACILITKVRTLALRILLFRRVIPLH